MQVEPHDASLSKGLAAEFAAAMGGMAVGANARVAVAVSGGADSMALALLLTQWARGTGVAVHALTVDHRLREASADEARQVAAWLASRGIAHATLRWEEGAGYRDRPSSAQSAAREGRYRLMLDWCAAHGCTHLFLAHHADDQAETFLQRLVRGSGVDGLAAMAPLVERAGIMLARPLLAVSKARLAAYLDEIGQPWVEDPSNQDTAYLRTRMRAAREVLEREGLSRDRLLATANHMGRARLALDHYTRDLLDKACAWDKFGIGRIRLDPLLAAPEEVGLRALARALMTGSGQVYRPRFERLARLYESLRAGPWRDSTLHGCVLVREGSDLIVIREAAQIEGERILRPGQKTLWDGRFEIEGRGHAFRVRRVAAGDVPSALRDTLGWGQLPAVARETLPGAFDSRGLAVFPHLDYVRPDLTTQPGVGVSAAFFCPRPRGIEEIDAEL